MNSISQTIHVAFVSDKNYLHFVHIAVTSLLDHHKNGNLVIHLFTPPDICSHDLEQLIGLKNIASFDFQHHFLEPREISCDFKYDSPIMWRLAIPGILTDVDRLLYLDADLVFCDDVAKLWNIDLQGKIIGAVGDRAGHKIALPEINPTTYFNSGVMLWDLKRMREEQVYEKWKTTFAQHDHNLKFADQTLLNLVHKDDSLLIPQNWNLINSIYRNPPVPGMYTVEETIDALKNPGIAHFTGHHKPWILWKYTHHVYANRFWYYAIKAPIPKRMKCLIWFKRYLTGRLHEPKTARPWNKSIIRRNW